MSHFIFKAKRPGGDIYESKFDGSDRYELYRMLRQQGNELISVEETRDRRSLIDFIPFKSTFSRIKATDKINFARSLGSMLVAGLALHRALSVLERQTQNKKMRAVITDLSAGVDRGLTFSQALQKYPHVFPALFVAMVHAGEQSGSLADALKTVSSELESSHSLTRRVRGALIYPAVIVVLMIIIGVIMLTFVVPTLMKTFTELHVSLPATTQMVLNLSNALQNHSILIVVVLGLISAGIYFFMRQPSGKRFADQAVLKIPIVGSLVQEVNTARTTRTLSSLLRAGVDVVEALEITSEVVQNVLFKEVLVKVGEAIKRGDLMSRIFGEHTKLYPVFMVEMIGVGEESGKMDEMLAGIAAYYEDDVDQKTKNMSTVIEPIIMVVIASAVGFFAVAMISPMYSLVNAI